MSLRKTDYWFFLILFIQLCVVVYLGMGKVSLFLDEWWSYNIANYSEFLHGDASDVFYKLIPQSFWLNSVTVSPDTAFNFSQVWENSARDVHPPLYYALLHAVCSFFPSSFSMAYGLSLNFFFFILTQIFLWLICKRLFDKDLYSLLVVFLFGFSLAAINLVLTLRMYMMLTCFVLLSLWINFIFIENRGKKSIYVLLALWIVCNVLGFLTNYYYIVCVFSIALFSGIILLLKKRYSFLCKYVICGVISVVLSYLIFPDCVDQLFANSGAYRGREAINSLLLSDFLPKLERYLLLLEKLTRYELFFCFLVIVFVIVMIRKCVKARITKIGDNCWRIHLILSKNHENVLSNILIINAKWLFLGCSTLLAFVFIVKSAPYCSFRYIGPLLPMFYILLIGGLALIANTMQIEKKGLISIVAILSIGSIFLMPNSSQIEWYFPQVTKFFQTIHSKDSVNCLGIMPDKEWRWILRTGYEYQQCDRTLFLSTSDLISNKFNEYEIVPDFVFLSESIPEAEKKLIVHRMSSALGKNIPVKPVYKSRGSKGWCLSVRDFDHGSKELHR